MLTQTNEERELYEARRKAQLDHNTGLKMARLEGQEEGLSKGEKIGTIQLCERVLHRPATSREQLVQLSLEELTRLAEALQKQLLEQR